MGNQNPNSTNYVHTFEPNTNDVSLAMAYNGQGEPVLRVGLSNIASSGNPGGLTAFGEPIAVPITPVIQLDGLYGLDPYEFETFTFGTGVAETTNTLMQTKTGTGAYGYGVVRSNRVARYRPGQGMMARFTAKFDGAQTGVTLRAGLFAQEQALMFGYDTNGKFGILIQNGGKAHIEKLTVTVGPGNGGGTVTITLNGVATVVAVTGTDTTVVAAQIAAEAFAGWTTEQVDNEVRFLSTSVGPIAGAFSATGTGTYTIETVQTGVAHNDQWTYQEDWDVDKMDGTGASTVNMDWSKMNIFQVDFRWLGIGEIRWSVENPDTGDMMFVHHSHFSNTQTDVHIDNPCFKIGYVAANLTANTITTATCAGASMMVAIEGILKDNAFSTGFPSDEKSSLGASVTTAHHIVSFKNDLTYKDKINLRLMKLRSMSVAFQGNDPAVIYLFLDAAKDTNHEWTTINTWSSVSRDVSPGVITITDNKPLVAYTLPINGSDTFDLSTLDMAIPPGSRVCVGMLSGQQMSGVRVSMNWIET